MSAARMERLRLAGIALVGCLMLGLTGATNALAETVTFESTGKEQQFKVPAGVTSIHVNADGAAGAAGVFLVAESPGGHGAIVSGDLTVTPGATLYVEVGGLPTSGEPACVSTTVNCVGGFNGGGSSFYGGGGGGASDVRTTSRTEAKTLESRLLVAAGGGGGGEACLSSNGNAGGGTGGDPEKPGGEGGKCGEPGGEGGGAGKETEGGAGGKELGKAGTLGIGGGGGGGTGGSGGGGLYGGGGGGTITFGPPESEASGAAGGGGGGSNLVPAGGTFGGTAKAGEAGSVTITYTLPTQTCGKTTIGKTGPDPLVANQKRVNKCVVPFNAAVSELTVYLAPTSFKGQELIKGVIYADSSGKPGALVGVTEQLTFKSTEAANWYPLKFASPVKVVAGTYWIGIITGNTGKVAGERWDTVSKAEDYNSNTYASGPSKTFGSFKTTNEEMSLYATFTREVQGCAPIGFDTIC